MKVKCLSVALCAAAFPVSAQAGDMLQLEPSSAPRSSCTSACMPSDRPSLCVRLSEKSAIAFANWTKDHVGDTIYIKIDNKLISAPRLLSQLTGGVVVLNFKSASEADAAEKDLRSGTAVLTISDHD